MQTYKHRTMGRRSRKTPDKCTHLRKQRQARGEPGINTWEQSRRRIHTLSHLHAVAHHQACSPHFELPRWQDLNAAPTQGIYAERTTNSLCVSNPISSSSVDACKHVPFTHADTHTHCGMPDHSLACAFNGWMCRFSVCRGWRWSSTSLWAGTLTVCLVSCCPPWEGCR